jgi:hypothetical protein
VTPPDAAVKGQHTEEVEFGSKRGSTDTRFGNGDAADVDRHADKIGCKREWRARMPCILTRMLKPWQKCGALT